MASRSFILFASDSRWRIAWLDSAGQPASVEIATEPRTPLNDLAAALASALRDKGHTGQSVLLALPAQWCLAATIQTAGIESNDRASRLYRLEEKLPIAAEAMVADFIEHEGSALGVAAPLDRVSPLVDALESAGVAVQSIVPAALLALQAVQSPGRLITLSENDLLDLFALQNNKPIAWATAQPDDPALPLHLAVLRQHLPDSDQSSATSAAIDVQNGGTIWLGGAVLSGKVKPWIELRRQALAVKDSMRSFRTSLNAALVCAAILFLCIAGALVLRGKKYAQVTLDAQNLMESDFKKEFSNMPVPPNPRAVILSEKRKLMLAGNDALPPETRHSALRLMRDVLANLPAGAKINLQSARFYDTSIDVTGEMKTSEEIGALVQAARAAGLEVSQPEMRKTATNTWSFTLRALKPVQAGKAGEL